MIAAGEWEPGARLDEGELARRFGVSRTPIREALNQLAGIGVLDAKPNRGFFLAQISSERLIEMCEFLSQMEVVIARMAVRRLQETDRVALLEAQAACREMAEKRDPTGYDKADERLHFALYAASHNSYLQETAQALNRRLRSCYGYLQFSDPASMKKSCNEHQAILEAVFTRDAEAAAKLLDEHSSLMGSRILDYIAFSSKARKV